MAGPITLSGEEHHYLTKVRRQMPGATVCLLDGNGRWADAVIESVESATTQLTIAPPTRIAPADFALTIAPALIKGERMDQAVTKLVELGTTAICPLTTERTIVRLKGNRAASRHARFESLAKAAARQSRNPLPTSISPIQSLRAFLESAPEATLKLIPEASGTTRPLAELLPEQTPRSATVLIGPEGGFTPGEIDLAREAGFLSASLGPRVLRAETACIAVASILSFRYGDVGSI